jgi:mersacidin/lichenicidin family type 2 lantibiotic
MVSTLSPNHWKENIMLLEHIIRAWKDEDFRNSLSAKERALLPENPAGLVELEDTELRAVGGMTGPKCSWYCGGHTKNMLC